MSVEFEDDGQALQQAPLDIKNGMNLQIVDVGGCQVCDIVAPAEWTVRFLQHRIEQVSGIAATKQHLVLDGQILDTNDWLGDHFSTPDACITLCGQRDCDAYKEEWMCKVEDDWQTLRGAPFRIRADVDVILAAVQQTPKAINLVLRDIYDDRDKLLTILQTEGNVFQFLANFEDNFHTYVPVPRESSKWRLQFQYGRTTPSFRNDREMVCIAWERNVRLLRFATEEIKTIANLFYMPSRQVVRRSAMRRIT